MIVAEWFADINFNIKVGKTKRTLNFVIGQRGREPTAHRATNCKSSYQPTAPTGAAQI
jgi:hypothetical protein